MQQGRRLPKTHGNWWIYEGSGMRVELDDFSPNLHVYWQSQLVLDVHLGDLLIFKPGPWMQPLLDLTDSLLQEELKKMKEEEKRQVEAELERWTDVE